jgi:hypothetical protein
LKNVMAVDRFEGAVLTGDDRSTAPRVLMRDNWSQNQQSLSSENLPPANDQSSAVHSHYFVLQGKGGGD